MRIVVLEEENCLAFLLWITHQQRRYEGDVTVGEGKQGVEKVGKRFFFVGVISYYNNEEIYQIYKNS